MPIIDTHVEVKLNARNIKHFKSKGYTIPQRFNKQKILVNNMGASMLIKIEDLTPQSHVKVEILCPICNRIRLISYDRFMDSSDICNSCCGRIQGKASKGTKLPQMKGSNNPNWHGGKQTLQSVIRNSTFYKDWRTAVYERDGYTCRNCGYSKGGTLHCHHIVGLATLIDLYNITKLNWVDYKHILFDVDNGITLDKRCHKKFHDTYGYNNVNRKQLQEYLNG